MTVNDLNRIIVFKTGAIGDVLMSTPFLRALRKRFPNAQIDYWIGRWAKDVLEGNENINNLLTFGQNIFFKKNIFGLISLLLKIKKQRYDMAFVLDKLWVINYFINLSGIPKRVGFDRNGEGWPNTINVKYGPVKHEIDYYLELAYKVGASNEKDKSLEVNLSKGDRRFAVNFILKNSLSRKKIIGLAPAGGGNPGQKGSFKRFPKEKYINLIYALIKKGFRIIFFGSKSDVKYNDYIKSRIQDSILDITGKTTIKHSIALMKYLNYFICNDSGPMHMASAAGCRVISIFGPTDPRRLAPLNKGSVYIWKPTKYDPCYDIYGRRHNTAHDCMSNLSENDILRLIR